MSKILLVDDEPSILSVLSTLLKAEKYDVTPALGGEKALEILKKEKFNLMLSDIRMNGMSGLELLKHCNKNISDMVIIMLTAYGSVETAIQALKLGAFDYVTKPFKLDELLMTVQRALEYSKAITENKELKTQIKTRYMLENIIAESPAMQNVCEMIKRVAPTDTTILICGDSGTGKELVARAIHANSTRKDKKFMAVNCAALPEALLESEMFGHVRGAFTGATSDKVGLFESAKGGTIFLDEISSMPLSIQSKLLRMLQEHEIRRVGSNENVSIDARILTATNVPLEQMIKEGLFREDLYYRLSVIPLTIRPLRERVEDIIPLANHFIAKEVQGTDKQSALLDKEATNALQKYRWPGNVRELENAIKHALTFTTNDTIKVDVLPERIIESSSIGYKQNPVNIDPFSAAKGLSLKNFLRDKEQKYLRQVLEQCGGDKEAAAKKLKISLATFYRKMPDIEE
ncbi:MAG: sigma-54 dependent transcriptional regulator [Kiritimatiellae bacterium]|jgi:DNA-binding NtrC family response regulator|nr:sigma-54 dependent transcriptional regulator [Kiritimatiellia bacterium]